MFFVGLFIGGVLGIFTMCLMQVVREDAPVQISNLPECQIHPSYECLGTTECRGNPSLCESANLRR